ncbi:MAG TPA: hypothetical protein VNV43_06280 [Candidatus Acidoferrales bacterium]|nr:hypothetical protein [Candidatus Acidoferrales bacterium]
MIASAFSEPFTPRGIAAFARAGFRRLLVAQFIFALLAAAAVGYFFHSACFPAVQAAIDNLPLTGQIQSGRLSCDRQMLADGPFFAFNVDPDHSGQWRSTTADFQVEFGRDTVRVITLIGYADFFYPSDRSAPFNQPQLDPLWKAWRAVILFLIMAATLVILPAIWWFLMMIYFLPVWLIGFLTNRDLSLPASLKLSGSALLPGALLMTAAVFLYGIGLLNLVSFFFVFAAHFVLHWLYLLFGLFFLPRTSTAMPKQNPFKPVKE